MLIQSSAIAAILIMLPLSSFARQGLKILRPWTFLVYFAGLGLGFIMIEIVLIQRFLLFLGEPIYTFSVVLASLLVFSGVGAGLVGRFRDARVSLRWIILAILLVLLLAAVGSPWILTSALGLPLLPRIAIVVAMLAPLGVVLGMPFPIGLRVVAIEAPTFIPWAWGVNGFFTVIGCIGASILRDGIWLYGGTRDIRSVLSDRAFGDDDCDCPVDTRAHTGLFRLAKCAAVRIRQRDGADS